MRHFKHYIEAVRASFFRNMPNATEDQFIDFICSIDLDHCYLNNINPVEDDLWD